MTDRDKWVEIIHHGIPHHPVFPPGLDPPGAIPDRFSYFCE